MGFGEWCLLVMADSFFVLSGMHRHTLSNHLPALQLKLV
jgi:hypothetical protein